jgi:cytoskeletal protein RodZ
MKTTGQILHAARIDKKLDVEDVSRITRIRPQFIKALEADNYGDLPSATTTRGFIRNYAKFLGLNPEHLLAIFRRDFIENRQGQIVPRGVAEPVNPPSLWTPKTTIIAVVTLIFTVFGSYLFYQYRLLTGPPSLSVTSPSGDISLAQATVEVVGQTNPEAAVYVNGQLISLDKGGKFFFRLPLQPGPNQISVTAVAKSGRQSTISRSVNRVDNPPPSP